LPPANESKSQARPIIYCTVRRKKLVRQLEGSFRREDAQPGWRVTITIPDKAEQPP
jgi:hypothetical protein